MGGCERIFLFLKPRLELPVIWALLFVKLVYIFNLFLFSRDVKLITVLCFALLKFDY